jgi:hypothetical protein
MKTKQYKHFEIMLEEKDLISLLDCSFVEINIGDCTINLGLKAQNYLEPKLQLRDKLNKHKKVLLKILK